MDKIPEKQLDCPRPYRLGKREEAQERNRARILDAARLVLLDREANAFSMEAVARWAGVTRQTVYNLYGSKGSLLAALMLRSARGTPIMGLAVAFQNPDPLAGLMEFVRTFARFWSGGAELTRRIRGLAALDPELGEAMHGFQERRMGGIRALVSRIQESYGRPDAADDDEAIPAVYMLTSFECYDMLRLSGLPEDEIPELLVRLARAALRLPAE
jgi:AcrR family transcriptional regulator